MTGSSADSEALAQPHPEAVTRMPLSLTRTACGAAGGLLAVQLPDNICGLAP